MRDILDIVKPTPDARYVVFYSFSEVPQVAAITTFTRFIICGTD
jgi:DMSO/TMAO reductase YedYZ molybdopterin-dependent catalytic subunit